MGGEKYLWKPSGIKQLSAIPKHPFFKSDLDTSEIVIVVNGEEIDGWVTTADTINGYVKFYPKRRELGVDKLGRAIEMRVKGRVDIFINKKIEDA